MRRKSPSRFRSDGETIHGPTNKLDATTASPRETYRGAHGVPYWHTTRLAFTLVRKEFTMQLLPQIAFRGFAASPELEAEVIDRVRELEDFCDRITSCHVVVEAPHHHHHTGNLYHVRIHVSVPRKELVVDREPSEHHASEQVLVALRDAFDAMRRQLEDYVRETRRDVKHHDLSAHARVKKIFPEADYGFLETADGREIFFHANSVLDGFDRLTYGAEVRYVEEQGEKGPQATSVRRAGRHHHLETE
jgi:cold shock CspA family protein